MGSDEEPAKPEKGRIIANKYLLERELGEGGMGSVWVAKHLTLDIHQAIKFIRSGRAEASRERFQKEAALLARFHGSDHVVQIRDYGDDDGLPYIVMDLLYGQTLYERLKSWSCLTMRETNHILQQIVSGLELAHSQKIIHRDLKPANIFLARSRQGGREIVKILDFGIAKLIGPDSSAVRMTRGIGSVVYMSPEHCTPDESIDERSDLWSLGIVLFECLTGKLPYPFTEGFRVLAQLARGKGPTLRATDIAPRLPPEVDSFFEIAFAINRNDRFQSAGDMGRAFERVANALTDLTDMSDLEPTHARFYRSGGPVTVAPLPRIVDPPNDAAGNGMTSPRVEAQPAVMADALPKLNRTLELVLGRPLHGRSTLPFIVAPREQIAEPPVDDSYNDPNRVTKPAHLMADTVASPPAVDGSQRLAEVQPGSSLAADSGADNSPYPMESDHSWNDPSAEAASASQNASSADSVQQQSPSAPDVLAASAHQASDSPAHTRAETDTSYSIDPVLGHPLHGSSPLPFIVAPREQIAERPDDDDDYSDDDPTQVIMPAHLMGCIVASPPAVDGSKGLAEIKIDSSLSVDSGADDSLSPAESNDSWNRPSAKPASAPGNASSADSVQQQSPSAPDVLATSAHLISNSPARTRAEIDTSDSTGPPAASRNKVLKTVLGVCGLLASIFIVIFLSSIAARDRGGLERVASLSKSSISELALQSARLVDKPSPPPTPPPPVVTTPTVSPSARPSSPPYLPPPYAPPRPKKAPPPDTSDLPHFNLPPTPSVEPLAPTPPPTKSIPSVETQAPTPPPTSTGSDLIFDLPDY